MTLRPFRWLAPLAVLLVLAACSTAQRRPGPGFLDDGASCPWRDAPRSRGPAGLAVRLVEAGAYVVGCPPTLAECRAPRAGAEGSADASLLTYGARDHRVAISRGFWIAETELTERQLHRITGAPMQTGCASCAATFGRLIDASHAANALSERQGLQGCYRIDGDEVTWPDGLGCGGWRLPTGVEWEIAARARCDAFYAGSNHEHFSGAIHPDGVPPLQWEAPLPVRTGYPNGLGLYDMTGNVAEWVWEDLAGDRPPSPIDDGVAPRLGDRHVLRGGQGAVVSMWHEVDPSQPLPEHLAGWTGARFVRTAKGR